MDIVPGLHLQRGGMHHPQCPLGSQELPRGLDAAVGPPDLGVAHRLTQAEGTWQGSGSTILPLHAAPCTPPPRRTSPGARDGVKDAKWSLIKINRQRGEHGCFEDTGTPWRLLPIRAPTWEHPLCGVAELITLINFASTCPGLLGER